MKRFVSVLIAALLLFACLACRSDAGSQKQEPALNADESHLVEILKIISMDFNAPSEVRVLEIGDVGVYQSYLLNGMGVGEFNGVVVRLQGQNKSGGVSSAVYLIRLDPVMRSSAWIAAEQYFDKNMDYWLKNWNESSKDTYSIYSDTFDGFRKTMIEFYYNNYVFASEADAQAAAVKSYEDEADALQKKWDEAADSEYPRKFYGSFEEYRNYMIYDFYLGSYLYPYPDKGNEQEVYLYTEIEGGSIKTSAEGTYSVAAVNKALKDYWDARLGN